MKRICKNYIGCFAAGIVCGMGVMGLLLSMAN